MSYCFLTEHIQGVTTQASSGRGFGVCAACKARCDCPCIRQSCVDTSCCGEAGAVGPANGIPPPSDTFVGGNDVTVDIRYADNILIPKLFYIFHDYWY